MGEKRLHGSANKTIYEICSYSLVWRMKPMSERILFSLENCTKCNQVKQLLSDHLNVKIIDLSHDYSNWSEEEKQTVESFDVLDDLQITAPILWADGQKYIGFLRIKKWIQENE